MKFLQCYSSGDRRFSALYARLGSGQGKTIEHYYQGTKRDGYGKPFTTPEWNPGKGKQATYLFLNGQLVGNTSTLQYQFYTMLWLIYFRENPDLLRHACEHNGFYEKDTSEIWTPSNKLPYHRGCNQAASIAYIVHMAKTTGPVIEMNEHLHPEVKRSFTKYWGIYHPQSI